MTILDGAMGTRLQAMGLEPGEDPTDWNLDHPDRITAVHRAYAEAGADVVLTNTFGATRIKYRGRHPLADLVAAAVDCARAAGNVRVALDLGPTGKLLKPAGDLDFDAAYDAYAELVRGGSAAGADLVFIETISDTRELKAAILAAKENCKLPVYASVALQENGQLLTGADVDCVAELFNALDVDACGFNCGLGPDRLLPYVERLAARTAKPIIVKANAGMPFVRDGKTLFPEGPEPFAIDMEACVRAGASIIGGCCGTTPEHIRSVRRLKAGWIGSPVPRPLPPSSRVSSGTGTVELRPGLGLIIGERINPTGKKRLKEAYRSGDVAYVMREAVTQVEAGAAILDVNCGVPGIDEAATLDRTLAAVESVTTAPIQIDTADPVALETALRHVNGKPLVNSVNGKRESMDAVFPLAKKFGGLIVALCLDENGIPATVDGRLDIARRILAEGARYGFTKDDFAVDALTLAVSADPDAAKVTLETVRRLTDELGVNTVLGVSNVSFGLPNRPALNNAMYTLAKRAGLSAAIANPSVIRECDDEAAFDVLLGRDPNCARWIAANAAAPTPAAAAPDAERGSFAALAAAVRHGLRDDAAQATEALLAGGAEAMAAIDRGIVPALEETGKNFENGTVFLPQLLMAADAASAAFGVVRKHLSATGTPGKRKGAPIVIATVRGDVHDIGKNIVRALLENYGFEVIDLGRDVPPEEIVKTAINSGCKLVGLSALMTTTVGAMAETIRQLKAADPTIRTFVGGAVLTADYAAEIGATWYAKDAMASVRIAERESRESKNGNTPHP